MTLRAMIEIGLTAGGPGSGRKPTGTLSIYDIEQNRRIGIPKPEGPKYTSPKMVDHLVTHGFHHDASFGGDVGRDSWSKPGHSVSVGKNDQWDHFTKSGKSSGVGAVAFHTHMGGIKAGGPGSGRRALGAFRMAHSTALGYGYKPEASSGLSSVGYTHPSGANLSISRRDGSFTSSVRRAGGSDSGAAEDLGSHLKAVHGLKGV